MPDIADAKTENKEGQDDSDSEEDLDYNPTKREIAEAEVEERRAKKQKLDPENDLLKVRVQACRLIQRARSL